MGRRRNGGPTKEFFTKWYAGSGHRCLSLRGFGGLQAHRYLEKALVLGCRRSAHFSHSAACVAFALTLILRQFLSSRPVDSVCGFEFRINTSSAVG